MFSDKISFHCFRLFILEEYSKTFSRKMETFSSYYFFVKIAIWPTLLLSKKLWKACGIVKVSCTTSLKKCNNLILQWSLLYNKDINNLINSLLVCQRIVFEKEDREVDKFSNDKCILYFSRSFEEAICNYQGDDPLDNWYQYISWVEQSYPKNGHEGNLGPLLEDCLTKFEHDRRYSNDRRFCKLWIKYVSSYYVFKQF